MLEFVAEDAKVPSRPLYDRLRGEAPVYRVPGTGFHLVSSWELVTDAAARTTEFSSHLTAVLLRHPGAAATAFDLDGGGRAVHVPPAAIFSTGCAPNRT